LDVNPEPYTLPYYGFAKPASGCSADLVTGVATGWANYYVARYIRSFFTCTALADPTWANYSTVTHETFANKSSRDVICNGHEGKCTSTFCDDLYANMTKYTPPFCDAVQNAVARLRQCARDFRFVVDGPYSDPVKFSKRRVEDFDAGFYLRDMCLQSVYNDNANSLLLNTAVFAKCSQLGAKLTEGAKFYIQSGFSYSLGWTDRGPGACLATYSGGPVGAVVAKMVMLAFGVTVAALAM